MLKEFAKISYYVVLVLLALGAFTWAGLTGTRLLGDDREQADNKDGYYSSGRSGGHGYTRFYHK